MKLDEYLKKENMTQAQFSRKAGLNRFELCSFLKGKKIFSKRRALKVEIATQGKVKSYEVMFPDLDLIEVKKKDKNEKSQQEENKNFSQPC